MSFSLTRVSAPFLALTLALSACSSKSGNGSDGSNGSPVRTTPIEDDEGDNGPDVSPTSDATRAGRIFFDQSLSAKERGAVVGALDFLDRSPLLNADAKLLELMKIRRADTPTLRAWLEDRVQYVISEKADLDSIFTVVDQNFTGYENPGQFPPNFPRRNANAGKGVVVMSNVGAVLYLVAKDRHWKLNVKATGLGELPVSSPRTGVLQVGEGLLKVVPSKYRRATEVFQLTTLIHESRHSDGNKTTTGFLHAKCPASHKYGGVAACDHNNNGPYIIEDWATKAYLDQCNNDPAFGCTAQDKKILETLYADIRTRQIVDAETTTWDDAPEGRR